MRSERSEMASEVETTEDTVETFFINWDVPVQAFQVEQELYRPQPTRVSPLLTTVVGGKLSLDWVLVLTQGPDEARVTLEHRTTAVPNLGVRYDVNILRQGSNTTDRLSPLVRGQLAKTTHKDLDSRSFLGRFKPRNLILDRYLHSHDIIKIRAELHIDSMAFEPWRVCEVLLKEVRSQEVAGALGKTLWGQVLTSDDANTDVVYRCKGNEVVRAHMAVLSAFCLNQRRAFAARRDQNCWEIQANHVSAPAIREALHYLYNRRISVKLQHVPLNELMEAGLLFGLGGRWRLEVERLLVVLPLNPANMTRLWKLCETYDLPIARNMVVTVVALNSVHLRSLTDSGVRNSLAAAAAAGNRLTAPDLVSGPLVS